jgi:hypothetical protein
MLETTGTADGQMVRAFMYVRIKSTFTSARAKAKYHDMGGSCHVMSQAGFSLKNLELNAG